MTLRHYGGGGAPALFIPSLVNRADILDLSEDHSLLRSLARQGVDPWLLDWGDPGMDEPTMTLDTILARIQAALLTVHNHAGRPPVMVGYCMGGTLALAAAMNAAAPLAGLALLAAPWDFHADNHARALAALWTQPWLGSAFSGAAAVGPDLLQMLFLLPNPALALRKFRTFAHLDLSSAEAQSFVAIEDWLNDGIALPGPIAKICREEWYGANTPARGLWLVDGKPVDPIRIAAPMLVVVPEKDDLVPPAAALAVCRGRQADILRPPSGHVGMVAGSRAPEGLWRPLGDWIKDKANIFTAGTEPPRKRLKTKTRRPSP